MAIQSPSLELAAGAAVPADRGRRRRAATGSRSAAACGAIR